MLEEIVTKLKNGADDLAIRDLQILFAKSHPEQILKLSTAVLEEAANCRGFEKSMLALMPLDDWNLLVTRAMEKFSTSDIAQDIVAFATMQKPDSVHPYLKTLLVMGENRWRTPTKAWRGSGSLDQERLFRQLDSSNIVLEDRTFAFLLLLETRDEKIIAEAISKVSALNLFNADHQRFFRAYMSTVGLELENGTMRKLHSNHVLHVAFPKTYFPEVESAFGTRDKTYQPTWQLQEQNSIRPDAKIGGYVESRCKICSNQLHCLIEIKSKSALSDFYKDCPLTFVTCLSCQGTAGNWEMYFAHRPNGDIDHMYDGDPVTPEMVQPPFAQADVNLVDNGPRWAMQDAGLSNSWENLHRVGGEPTWVQDSEYLQCPTCSKTMSFAAQIDSGLPLEDGTEWMWGDLGICYLFFCGDCAVTGVNYQCY